MQSRLYSAGLALAAALTLTASSAIAEQHNFYVTVDGRPLATGAYAALPNPNQNRLTLLYAHWDDAMPSSNHFHGIGVYSYTGDAASPTVLPTNGNNRLPETFAAQAPLTLQAGSGAYAGKLVSGENGEHYSDPTLYSIGHLAPDATANPTSPEGYMYNSNAGYTSVPLAGVDLGLEVLAMSPGLKLGPAGLSAPGAVLPIGGETSLPFEPVFWTDAATPGTYSASLRLVDRSSTFLPSGAFHFDFAVVPEPSGLGLATGALGLLLWRRRRGG